MAAAWRSQARARSDIARMRRTQLEPAGEGDRPAPGGLSASSAFHQQKPARPISKPKVLRSRAPARIAGRCSVFAKSDMIHLQQKGTPVEDIVAGLCHALARSFKANVVGVKALELPVALVGGVAANAGVVKALRSVLHLEEDGLFVPEDFALSGAFGAALFLLGGQGEAVPYKGLAAFREGLRRRVPMKTLVPLQPVSVSLRDAGAPRMPGRRFPQGSCRRSRPSASSLPDGAGTRGLPGRPESRIPEGGSNPPHPRAGGFPARGGRRRLDPEQLVPTAWRRTWCSSVDIGSISTNIVLMDENREVVAKYYLMTASRPIEAVRTGRAGVGVTGSRRPTSSGIWPGRTWWSADAAHATAGVHLWRVFIFRSEAVPSCGWKQLIRGSLWAELRRRDGQLP